MKPCLTSLPFILATALPLIAQEQPAETIATQADTAEEIGAKIAEAIRSDESADEIGAKVAEVIRSINAEKQGAEDAIESEIIEQSPEAVASPVEYTLNFGPTLATPAGPTTHLGVSTIPLRPEAAEMLSLPPHTGLTIAAVAKDSPAEKAGLQEGDVISKLDDQILIQQQQFMVLIRNHKPGDTVTLTRHRDGKSEEVTATLVQHEQQRALDASYSSVDFGKRYEIGGQRAFVRRLQGEGFKTAAAPAQESKDADMEQLSKQLEELRKQVGDLIEATKDR